MPTKHNKPENTPESEDKKPLDKNSALFHDLTEYNPEYNPDEQHTPDNPWVTQTEGGFSDSREFYGKEEMDAALGSDPSLRKRVKPESEEMKTMSYTDRQTRFAVEHILEENEEFGNDLTWDIDNIITDYVDLIDYKKGDQEIRIKKGVKDKDLLRLEDALQNVKLVSAKKGERQRQLEIINKLLEDIKTQLGPVKEEMEMEHARKEAERRKHEKMDAKRREMEKLASEMGGYLSERREAGEALDKAFSEGKKDWDKIGKLNGDMYEASLGIMLLLRKLRDESPDKVLRLIPALDESVRRSFYPVLRAFFRTHNTGVTADEIKTYGERSKNINFANELSKFVEKAPQEDKEYNFHKDVTGLPDKVLGKLFHTVAREEAEEVRKAA